MAPGELLLEVRAEEIPARMLPGAARELATRLFEELVARGLTPGEIEAGFTPRRLWLVLKGLPKKEKDRLTRVVGPAAAVAYAGDGSPTKAAEGFARRLGVPVEQLRRREFSPGAGELDVPQSEMSLAVSVRGQDVSKPVRIKAKGEYVYLPVRIEGRETATVLAEQLPSLLWNLAWAKTMRWGSGKGPWVRPVHGLVALFEGAVVDFELFGVRSGRSSIGHPILSPEPFGVEGSVSWRKELGARGIVPSAEERKARLATAMRERAAALGGALVDDDELLERLAAICEIPGVLEGGFDETYLDLPREVLATSLRDHQSALTVERGTGLAPIFLTVMDRPDDPQGHVRAGNEWVVDARLADARFFWQKDRSRPLADRIPALASLAFHERLGSYAEKAERTAALARSLAGSFGTDLEPATVERAARLAKVDLTTETVREFTSLQGVVGGIYAREDGEPAAVWQAIYDQYRPAGAEDPLPRGAVGRIVALADRLDTLTGFFALGEKFWPSGSKDPFGLRRAATGVVRLALEEGAGVELGPALTRAVDLWDRWAEKSAPAPAGRARAWDTGWARPRAGAPLLDFLWDRAEYLFGLGGLAYDEIAAARSATGRLAALDLIGARACARAIHDAREQPEFLSVALATKRIVNILRDAGAEVPDEPDAGRFVGDAERRLAEAWRELTAEIAGARLATDFGRALAAIERVAEPLDRFFVEVLVMDPDLEVRRNRLALLGALRTAIFRIADLSAVVVDKAELRARTAD
jgi:glycyl-tRNA synthetase beta chain